MMKIGRKSIYEDRIKSKFSEIKKMLEGGASEKQVAKSLGIAYSTFNKYKASEKEFAELLRGIDRTQIVSDLRSALLKKALGFNYEEKKKYIKTDADGNENTYIEISQRVALPDVAAINLALKNWDSQNWSNDPQMMRLKREELDFKKEMALKEDW